jgi:hypothetical protein
MDRERGMDNLTLAAHEFMELVANKLKGHGLFLDIREVKATLSEAKYRLIITDDKYGNTYEFAVSRPMFLYEHAQASESIARDLHYRFHRDLDFFNAENAYKALSKEAKEAFNTACLERYFELNPGERVLAAELYESGLFDGYAGNIGGFGYTIRPKSITMELWSSLGGKK